MFRPVSVPFPVFHESYGAANANLPERTFAPAPLGHHRGGTGANGGGLSVETANVYTSPALQTLFDNSTAQLPHDHTFATTHNHGGYAEHPGRSKGHAKIKMEQQSDLAQQEAAAREYKPKLEGPLVGEKKPSHAIAQEYAKADPIYVAKTIALPRTYSHFRPIQGDGNCGWRAIGFSYFESLIQCGDINQLRAEQDRLSKLNEYLERVGGYSPLMFEDMTEVMMELMADIVEAVAKDRDAMPILTAKFNDEDAAAPMIYHLRLLAASWLKGNFAEYESYIPGDADSYCNEWILPVNKEIDQVEVILLFNVLLKPANMVLEIAYLDRTEGDEVNVHRMPEEAKNQDPATLGPIIYLLYRPGHYDILYRPSVSIQVNRVASFNHQHEIQSNLSSLESFSTLNMSPLAMIPGYEPPPFSPLASGSSVSPPIPTSYSPSTQSAWLPQAYADRAPSAPSPLSSQTSQPSPPQQPPQDMSSLASLRFSKHMFPVPGTVDASAFPPEPTFTTNIFKQSYFNTAHYNNPHFQPEEYKPDQDDEIPTSRMGVRKRST